MAEYRRLYHDVGARWRWTDRDAWPDEQLAAWLADPSVRVFVARVRDTDGAHRDAGYFELRRHAAGDVEIVYFGLVERWLGAGLGGAMLIRVVEEARAYGAGPVWLHTCTLDGPHAMANYLARGFRVTREEDYEVPD